MSMTHKEALLYAHNKAFDETPSIAFFADRSDWYAVHDELFLRAYIEARGLVLVPKVPTADMQGAALQYVTKQKQTRDVYRAMLIAAPDPFGTDTGEGK